MSGRKSTATKPATAKPDAACARRIRAVTPRLLAWFMKDARDLPWRRTLDPYAVWISEIMLQQTQVKAVIPYYDRWLRALPDVQVLAEAPQDKVLKLWEGLGYYTRARNLQKAAQQIVVTHHGRFPKDFAAILELPGIGRYTAGAIASIAFNQPQPILDGNVIRVLTRLFAIQENPRDKATNARLWELAGSLVQAASAQAIAEQAQPTMRFSGACSVLNQSLMELGALICTPQKPACAMCPLQKNCAAFQERLTEVLPNLGERTKATARSFYAFVLRDADRFLLNQRPTGVVNAHLWEFPNLEVMEGSRTSPESMLSKAWGWQVKSLQPLTTIRHTITRYRITVQVYQATVSEKAFQTINGQRWVSAGDLETLALTSAHRRIARAMANQGI